jgi:uncharacterized SAM-binding protein YcdF (DUF218 family)
MIFLLFKILYFLFTPLVWITAIFLFAVFTKNQKRKKRLFRIGVILLIVLTNPFVLNTVMKRWEVPSRTVAGITVPFDVGIMLGGSMRYYNGDVNRPVYGSGVDRLIQTVELYKAGKIKKILLSGGSGRLLQQQVRESQTLKDVLVRMAVPEEDIILENESRTTNENIKFTSELLKSNPELKNILLITSGFHMRRSLACCKKYGLTVTPFSVDERSGEGLYTPDKILIPDAEVLVSWDILMHEWAGFVMYKLAGYI